MGLLVVRGYRGAMLGLHGRYSGFIDISTEVACYMAWICTCVFVWICMSVCLRARMHASMYTCVHLRMCIQDVVKNRLRFEGLRVYGLSWRL